MMVNKRRSLLDYLRKDEQRYTDLIAQARPSQVTVGRPVAGRFAYVQSRNSAGRSWGRQRPEPQQAG